jgi:hypothetical protein
MDGRILVRACGMGLGSGSAHGRAHLGVRMRNGVGMGSSCFTHPQHYFCFVMEKKVHKAKHLRHSSMDMRPFNIAKELPSLLSLTRSLWLERVEANRIGAPI